MKSISTLAPRLALYGSLFLAAPQIARATAPDALTPVPLQDVAIDDAFWSPKLDLWRTTTINDVFNKFEQYGGFQNFDRVAAGQKGGHQGDPWCDGLIYETLRAAGDFLATHPDPALQARVRGFVARISAAAAKDPDGYINTAQQLDGIGIKWTNPAAPGDTHDDNFPHTIYNAGCLMDAGIHLYLDTGDTELLKVATRLANYMCSIMGPAPKQNIIPGHAIGEESFTKLYRLYRDHPELKATIGLPVNEQDYFNLAQFWIENRGNTAGRTSAGAYNQDDVSVFQQQTMEGHAVRSALLASGIAAAALDNSRSDYRGVVEKWWQNMVQARMYLTGGIGSDASNEGFSTDYQLPNDGYAETCAAAANGFFSQNMNLLTGDAKYTDILERELYNGALGCVSLAGDNYFYTNPLSSGPDHRRWVWAGPGLGLTPCCPPMFLKLQSALPGLIYATKDSSIFVNLYIAGHATIHNGPLNVQLTQTTFYPWNGQIQIAVQPAVGAEDFSLNLRLPGWAKNPVIQVNGQTVADYTITKGYATLTRHWSAGDVVTLNLPMPVEKVKAATQVKADTGRTALMRGPLVYCFEGLDNNESTRAMLMSAADSFSPTWQAGLLGGVMQLQGSSTLVRNDGGVLRKESATVKAIPFYTNQNRQATTMDVWVADDTGAVRPTTGGTAASSYCNPGDTVTALNDGVIPRASDDYSVPRMTWWDHKGTSEWAQITYDTPRNISSADVYWWDERRVNRDCRVPQSWSVQYLDNGQWKPVIGASPYGVAIDQFNYVTFQSVQTTGIRIVVQLQAGWSGGIVEMVVGASNAVPSASTTFASDTVTAMNDGVVPSASDDDTIARQTFWNHVGTAEWAQLTFDRPRQLSSLEVYWWDERRVGRDCRVPQSWSLQYLDNGQWKPVEGVASYGTQMDAFNQVNFTPVQTTALRLQLQLQTGWSAGILELRAYEPTAVLSPLQSWLQQNGLSTDADLTTSPNGDGVSLLAAYSLGLDPKQNQSGALPRPTLSGQGVSLSFWGARTDVTYGAERSSDLLNWSPSGVTLSSPDENGNRTVILPTGAARDFLRLNFSSNGSN